MIPAYVTYVRVYRVGPVGRRECAREKRQGGGGGGGHTVKCGRWEAARTGARARVSSSNVSQGGRRVARLGGRDARISGATANIPVSLGRRGAVVGGLRGLGCFRGFHAATFAALPLVTVPALARLAAFYHGGP